MSNTDGEDTQKVSLGELLLNAGTRIVDLEKQSNDQVEIITHLEKQLASLREQLAGAEQQIKSLNEIIENLMNDEKDDMINLREQLAKERNKTLGDVEESLHSLVEFGFIDVPWVEILKKLELLKK